MLTSVCAPRRQPPAAARTRQKPRESQYAFVINVITSLSLYIYIISLSLSLFIIHIYVLYTHIYIYIHTYLYMFLSLRRWDHRWRGHRCSCLGLWVLLAGWSQTAFGKGQMGSALMGSLQI